MVQCIVGIYYTYAKGLGRKLKVLVVGYRCSSTCRKCCRWIIQSRKVVVNTSRNAVVNTCRQCRCQCCRKWLCRPAAYRVVLKASSCSQEIKP